MMTLKEALRFFAEHGNVASSIDELHETRPTIEQLNMAVTWAKENFDGDPGIIEAARQTVYDWIVYQCCLNENSVQCPQRARFKICNPDDYTDYVYSCPDHIETLKRDTDVVTRI